MAIGLLLALVSSASGLAQPLAVRAVIDALGVGDSLLPPVLVLCTLIAVSGVANGVNTYLLGRVGEQVVFGVRRHLSSRLVRLRVPELDARSPGDLISRATADTNWIRTAAALAPVQIVNGTVGLIGALILMAVLDLRLFGVTLIVLIVVGGIVRIVMPRIREATEHAQTSVGRVGSALDRALGASRTVKAAGAEEREQTIVERASAEAYEAGLLGARWNAVLSVVSEMALQVSFLIVLGVGGAFVAAGTLSVSTLVAFLLYLFYITAPLSELVRATTMIQQGLGAAARVSEVYKLEVEPDVDHTHAPSEKETVNAPALEFEGVRFSYPGREEVLRGVAFTVPAGSRVALVGPSGAGKSTIFSLLLRFYDATAGVIRLDETDIGSINRGALRSRIGHVEQDAPVLEGTLRENLCYAAPHASANRIAEVIRETHLSSLVERLPEGIDTQLGARGVTLSGGERQRLAIARAFLRRPGLLLLDEATAHLDARTEDALRDTLMGGTTHCTVFVIAHRLATVRDADRVVVLDRGYVRAIGNHEELIAHDDLYHELAVTQLQSG
ncbi:ATP-binding cassette domain-containing protein [Allosaccharopolyspora coralli]|uniref:ATP-binding cassette domain-containing protein n=1 Tax=Allosaccharopolyspora coralli TaxID=2665642 RepID=A0A5Q3Q1W7_9PSEU|nr:ABC transporter ATP-binding protein [Allosaccharopolyspora coralli]QGK68482.1 ATP-binding cassette domain-containing protein [Allosaccharopolyspora coralli]